MFTYLFSEKEKRLRDHVNCISYPEKFCYLIVLLLVLLDYD